MPELTGLQGFVFSIAYAFFLAKETVALKVQQARREVGDAATTEALLDALLRNPGLPPKGPGDPG